MKTTPVRWTSGTPVAGRRAGHRPGIRAAAAAAALLAAAIVVTIASRDRGPRPVSAGEAESTAESLLAERFAGPRYFTAVPGRPVEPGGPWLDVVEVRHQLPRVAAARGFGAQSVADLQRLIERLAEPHPSRAVGGGRVNLLRLNLSLDAVK